MPRFDDKFLDCSIYLYPVESDARRGERIGGSGFLAAMPVEPFGPYVRRGESGLRQYHLYAVSNRHVVQKHPVVRLNTEKGDIEVFPFSASDWTFTTDQDIAVVPIQFDGAYKFLCISTDSFVTRELVESHDIGIGDEVFMVGRFVSHDGKQRNMPAVRWGHVSMMPSDAVYHASNARQQQESYLVEIHSICGYSGSPVFVRPFPTPKLSASPLSGLNTAVYESVPYYNSYAGRGMGGPWLLGVDWGYINNHDQGQNNTGMSGVVPAWRVLELLNTEKLVKLREQEETAERKRYQQGNTALTDHDADPGRPT